MSIENQSNNQFYTYTEAGAYLRLSPATLRRWVCQKKIGCHKVGGRVLFTQADLNDVVQSFPAEK